MEIEDHDKNIKEYLIQDILKNDFSDLIQNLNIEYLIFLKQLNLYLTQKK